MPGIGSSRVFQSSGIEKWRLSQVTNDRVLGIAQITVLLQKLVARSRQNQWGPWAQKSFRSSGTREKCGEG